MEVIGDFEYNTKDLIGHGAFAVVFKGRHRTKHEYPVAIKSITKKNLAKSQNLLGKEIKILKELSELKHTNVVALLDCKETQHHVYLVMEYCNGGDLADYLSVKKTLSEDTIRLFLRQIAGAMKALFTKGIVHRDLKPQNILLCHEGNNCNPSPNEIKLKIADFGFARFLHDGVMATTLCGSPMYMSPEVIMSLQYDAKADLWSIGTIVFQCLTGRAPFQAQTPQALKQFYEKTPNLAPKIPTGTSPELTDLLMRLLRRNAVDRMEFDEFFEHPFLRQTRSRPVPVPRSSRASSVESSPMQSPVSYGSPMQLPQSQNKNKNENQSPSSSGSSDQVDDFVLVSATDTNSNIPSSGPSPRHSPRSNSRHRGFRLTPTTQPEPVPVPSQKQAFEQIQRSCSNTSLERAGNVDRTNSHSGNNNAIAVADPTKSPNRNSALQRNDSSNSIASEGSSTTSRSRYLADITQLSPPTVQFAATGTPPGSIGLRRRQSLPVMNSATSGTGRQTQTPPTQYLPLSPSFQNSATSPSHSRAICAPVSSAANIYTSPIIGSPPREYPVVGAYPHNHTWRLRGSQTDPAISTNINLNMGYTPRAHPYLPTSRAIGYSEVQHGCSTPGHPPPVYTSGGAFAPHSFHPCWGGYVNSPPSHFAHSPYGNVFSTSPHDVVFEAPELPEETLLDRDHNEILAKLNFVLALVDCIIELAQSKSNPLTILTDSNAKELPDENHRKAEQLVLYVRSLQLLSASLQLSRKEIESGRLRTSQLVRSVLRKMRQRFHHCLNTCKSLDYNTLLQTISQKTLDGITADKLIYNYAIEMCQSAALEELFGQPEECFRRYQTAQILLHSLSQQVSDDDDKRLLNKYKEAVEKRLFVLQSQGIVLAYDNTT